jgi:hypothetical protein
MLLLMSKAKDIGNNFGRLIIDKVRVRHASGSSDLRVGCRKVSSQGIRRCARLVGNCIKTQTWST